MARGNDSSDGHRRPRPRLLLPDHAAVADEPEGGMTHLELVEALRDIDGLVDVAGGSAERPNMHLRHKPFLHFHVDPRTSAVYADVRLRGGPAADFEPVWAST